MFRMCFFLADLSTPSGYPSSYTYCSYNMSGGSSSALSRDKTTRSSRTINQVPEAGQPGRGGDPLTGEDLNGTVYYSEPGLTGNMLLTRFTSPTPPTLHSSPSGLSSRKIVDWKTAPPSNRGDFSRVNWNKNNLWNRFINIFRFAHPFFTSTSWFSIKEVDYFGNLWFNDSFTFKRAAAFLPLL
jgi:hypothetical protein